MKQFKNIYYGSVSLLPLTVIKKISPVTCIFPYAHVVSNEHLKHIKNLYNYKNVKQFISDLDYLLKNFKPIDLFELEKYLETNNEFPASRFLYSFDDGYKEIYEVIAPILYSKGIPAIFFINPAYIDNNNLFYRCKISIILEELQKVFVNDKILNFSKSIFGVKLNLNQFSNKLREIDHRNQHLLELIASEMQISFTEYLKNNQPYLNFSQLKILHEQRFTIGAHSWDHPYYKYLNLNDQLSQTLNSIDYIRTGLHFNNVPFSFPHEDEAVKTSFFKSLRTYASGKAFIFGTQNQKWELNNKVIHRFNAERPNISIRASVKGILMNLYRMKFLKRYNVVREE